MDDVHLFNRHGHCLLHIGSLTRSIHGNTTDEADSKLIHEREREHDRERLLWGLLFGVCKLMDDLAPIPATSIPPNDTNAISVPKQAYTFFSFSTGRAEVHVMQTPTGMRVVGTCAKPTVVTGTQMQERLQEIYKIYVDYAVRTPLYIMHTPLEESEGGRVAANKIKRFFEKLSTSRDDRK